MSSCAWVKGGKVTIEFVSGVIYGANDLGWMKWAVMSKGRLEQQKEVFPTNMIGLDVTFGIFRNGFTVIQTDGDFAFEGNYKIGGTSSTGKYKDNPIFRFPMPWTCTNEPGKPPFKKAEIPIP